MTTEYEIEPIPGLPGNLPQGERILWQGSPDWKRLARTAFHTRGVAIYFAILTLAGLAFALTSDVQGLLAFAGTIVTVAVGAVGVALMHGLAILSARSTIYTLTNKRVVLRIGIALPKCINLPLTTIEAADLRGFDDGTGDIALALTASARLGYLQMWPHARPWHVNRVQPMLRAVPKASEVAELLARASGATSEGTANPQLYAVAA